MSNPKQLGSRDLQALLAALADLYADTTQGTLAERTLRAIANLFSAEITTFDCWKSGAYSGTSWGDIDLNFTAEQIEIFNTFAHQNPVFTEAVLKQRTEAVRLSDFLSFQQFRNTTLYNEFYRRVGSAESQIAIALPVSSDFSVTFQMNRSARDFSERDRLIVNLVAPHLTNAIRSTFAFERLNSALEKKETGVIAIDGNGNMQFVSTFARQLLEKYFGTEKQRDNLLPESLWTWIKHSRPVNEFAPPSLPLTVRNANGELTVRAIYNSKTFERTLLLEEKRTLTPKMLESLHLTKRESEVLFWMAQGKSDGDIAVLCRISPHTVHKHAQNIYIKLGVETRTAAMLKALDVL